MPSGRQECAKWFETLEFAIGNRGGDEAERRREPWMGTLTASSGHMPGQSDQGVRRGAPFRRGFRAAAMALAAVTAPPCRNLCTCT